MAQQRLAAAQGQADGHARQLAVTGSPALFLALLAVLLVGWLLLGLLDDGP